MAIVTETTPAMMEARAPQSMRERRSRPSSSVPNQYKADGAFRMLVKLGLIGSYGAKYGPTRATRTKNRTMAPPTTALLFFRNLARTRLRFFGSATSSAIAAVAVMRRASGGD